ncbi:putative armadillo-like helical protein [Helianthus annuus]|nr:putative armadillo-like helical protein [Helianthus annuus]
MGDIQFFLTHEFSHSLCIIYVTLFLDMIKNPHYLYRMTVLRAISLLAPVMGSEITLPNIKFNVAKVLQSLVPIVDHSVVEKSIKPCLVELAEDPVVDVRYFANQALQSIDQVMMSS